MGIVGQDEGEHRVGALIKSLNRVEPAADEQRLQYHLVPAIVVELLSRVRVAVGNRLEHRPHVGPQSLGRLRFQCVRVRIKRETAIKGNRLADIGRSAKVGKQPWKLLTERFRQSRNREHSSGGVHRPAGRIPILARQPRLVEIIFTKIEIGLAKPARHQTEYFEDLCPVGGA